MQMLCEKGDNKDIVIDDHAFPNGAIMFFDDEECPAGWSTYGAAEGRAVVALPNGGEAGATVESALDDGEDREHSHDFSGSITVPQQSTSAAGGSNSGPGHKGTYSFSGTTSSESSGVPYIQQLVCQADDRDFISGITDQDLDVIVPGTVAFFETASCPAGWERPTIQRGRMLLPLMDGATPFAVAGGDPLAPAEDRSHGHTVSGSINVPSHGLTLVAGCCFHSTGEAGTYGYSLSASVESSGFPYISLLVCHKQ